MKHTHEELRALCDDAIFELNTMKAPNIDDFIAATDPPTVRALLDEVDRYKAELISVRGDYKILMQQIQTLNVKVSNYDYRVEQALKGTDDE